MKLREIILKNFRGYYAETRITIDDLTALIGKNDVGKSTILEALDIFFNQSKILLMEKQPFGFMPIIHLMTGLMICC